MKLILKDFNGATRNVDFGEARETLRVPVRVSGSPGTGSTWRAEEYVRTETKGDAVVYQRVL